MEASALPVYRSARELLGRYDRKSLAALALLAAVQLVVGLSFRRIIAANPWMWGDRLLGAVWLLMTALLAWDVRPRRDLALVAAGLAGGCVIEWWGTTTQLWTYYTAERPPLWILPAWPVAALAIDRIARMLTVLLRPSLHLPTLYWILLPAFIAWMLRFMAGGSALDVPSSWVVAALMLWTLCWRPRPDRDACIFLSGTALGVLLEYWGTSRRCWTYYTREVPPGVAVLAHGFASAAFSRGVQLLEQAAARLRRL